MGEEFNITGTWSNRLTGDTIVVRNTVIDGDNMLIFTADGRQLTMEEFQNYVQVSDEVYDEHGKMMYTEKSAGPIVGRDIENERRVKVGAQQPVQKKVVDKTVVDTTVKKQKPEIYDWDEINKKSTVTVEESESEKLLNKLFEKIKLNIKVNLNIECDNFPETELKMLQNIYDVSSEDIAEYFKKHIIDDTIYVNAITNYVDDMLS